MSPTCNSTGWVRAFAALAMVLLVSCRDRDIVGPNRVDPTVGGLSPSLETQAITALGCTVSWKDPVNGLWTDAAKWDGGVVPGAADDVCITAAGVYAVTLRGAQVARGLTIGAAGASAQTLIIEGSRPTTTGSIIPATLTVETDVVNSGTIRLTSSGFPSAGSTLAVTSGKITNAATGVIRTLTGPGGARSIAASLINEGTIDIATTTSLSRADAQYTNNNEIMVASGQTLSVVGTFIQEGGTLNLTGAYSQTGGNFQLNNGAITGIPALNAVALSIGAYSSATGTIRTLGASTLTGDVVEGQTIIIEGIRPTTTGAITPATLTAANGFRNAGTIRLTSSGFPSAASTLAVTSGTLVNAATGVIQTLAGSGGARSIAASFMNEGMIDIAASTGLSGTDGHYMNNNEILVATGRTLSVTGTFTQAGGTLNLSGAYTQTGGDFHLAGGAVIGTPILTGVALTIGAYTTATGTLRLLGTSTLTGDVKTGQTLIVEGSRPTTTGSITNASLTSANSFRNEGTIRLTSSGFPSAAASLAVTSGTLFNAATGVIQTTVGVGGGRSIAASMINSGTIDFLATTSLTRTDAEYTNSQAILVASGQTLSVVGTFVQADGTLNLTGAYTQTGGNFHLNGGAIIGIPSLTAVALNIGAYSSATGTVRTLGVSTLSGDVAEGQTILIEGSRPTTTGAITPASLTAASSFRNGGTIRLTSSGFPSAGSTLSVTSGLLYNAPTGRIETLAGVGGGRSITGSLINDGTVNLGVGVTYSAGTFRNVAPATISGGNAFTVAAGASFFGTGSLSANIVNSGQFNVGASPGLLNITGTFGQTATGAFNVEIGGSVAGTDFDRLTVTGAASLAGTLNVSLVSGACAEPGSSFEFMTFASRTGDFLTKNGLVLGGGRTATPLLGATSYRLNVAGPPCVAPDLTPPVIVATVVGPAGNDGWYLGDVSVTWQISDAESAISSSSGCGVSQVLSDHAGITFTCSATSAGGSHSASVTIKRDATAPVVLATRAPDANAHGWNNTEVSASFSATDDMSGIDGAATGDLLFTIDGPNQTGSLTFADVAGNVTVGIINGISIDTTEPTVYVTRSVEPNAHGWNNTDVGVTFSATDDLSGIDGTADESVVFSLEGQNQSDSRTFADRAGNVSSAIISDVSIDRTVPVVDATRSIEPNAFGWNNSDVTATFTGSDALSGIDGASASSIVFSAEGADQSGSHTFTDRAGNAATAAVTGVSIDKTAPAVTVTRSPEPNAMGWNNTDVTAIFSATDLLSGIDGAATATVLFSNNGANQSATRNFADLAGNTGSGTISGINIDKSGPAVGVACSANPSRLWPANHRMVAVSVSFAGADGRSTVSSFLLRAVTSNESHAATDVQGFTLGTADDQGSLRATRDGSGSGRIYRLMYDVQDRLGFSGECVVEVTVPHDQRKLAAKSN